MTLILDKGHYLPVFSRICFYCKNWDRNNFDKPGTCKAFKDGIPEDIWLGKHDHTKPYKGDHGIQFESIED